MPKIHLDDTITALATAPGEGGIAIIRISGKDAVSLADQFFCSPKKEKLAEQPSHTIHHGFFVDEKQEEIDEVLISVFRAPHSFTGEEVVEINCHGGMRLVKRIVEILVRHGARPAEPGEFTKRAFLHGKIDLTQAEAVLDLIRARSEISVETALRQFQGRLSQKINQLKESLLKISAHLEASLDFPEERLDVDSREACLSKMKKIEDEVHVLISSFKRGQVMQEGVLLVIIGRPNVGKSSLLNALLARDRALVSAIPGTTRDALEEALEIGGFSVRLVDTAGLLNTGARRAAPLLDQMGMERSRRYLDEGDIFLFVVDGSYPWTPDDEFISSELHEKNFIMVANKKDLVQKLNHEEITKRFQKKICFISCTTGEGLPDLEKEIHQTLNGSGIIQEGLTLTRLRHKLALEEAAEMLGRCRKTLEEKQSAEFVLIDLYSALDSLREIIGEVYSEDLLDVIFQEFCIGK